MLLRVPLKYILMVTLMILSCCTIAFATSVPNIHQPLWSVSFPDKAKPFDLAAHDQQLIVTFVDNSQEPSQPRSLAAATGKLKWQSKQTIFEVLAIENNNIYGRNVKHYGEVDDSKKLVTLDANTGKAKSVFWIKDASGNSYEAMGVDQGAFILEESRSNQQGEAVLHAIKSRTAQKTIWTFTAPANSQTVDSSTTVVKNGIILVELRGSSATESKGSRLLALKASTGQELWTHQSLDSINKQLIGKNVYVMTNKSIRALDAQTGRELWVNRSLGGTEILTGDRSKTKPNIQELFILDRSNPSNSASTHLTILDSQTGKQLREINLPVRFESSRLLSNNMIYVVDFKVTEGGPLRGGNRKEANSWVNAFDASTGKLLWRTPEIKQRYIDSIVVSGDRLFLAANSLRSKNPDLPGLVQSFGK
jgi:outer membrane protein assembly factor BamB